MKDKSLFKTFIDQISGIFIPVINLITAASLIKSVLILLVSFGAMTTENGIYRIFYAVADGFFYFLPFALAVTAAKQWSADPFIAMMIPAGFLYPEILALLENGKSFSFIGLSVPPAVYHSSVIPVLLAVALLHFVERPCDRFLPESIKGFMKPVICVLIVMPLTFLVFGPIGAWIGNGLTRAFFVLYDWNAVVAGAFMGLIIQPMVSVGAHWAIVPVALSNIQTQGFDVIMPLLAGAVYAQAGASFAVGIIERKDKEASRVAFQSGFTSLLGVTEPSLYSVNLPRITPFVCALAGGMAGGALCGGAGAHCISFAFPSLLTCIAFVGPGFGLFMLSMLLGLVVGFLLTMIFWRPKASSGVR